MNLNRSILDRLGCFGTFSSFLDGGDFILEDLHFFSFACGALFPLVFVLAAESKRLPRRLLHHPHTKLMMIFLRLIVYQCWQLGTVQ